jgi:hypothetical protein
MNLEIYRVSYIGRQIPLVVKRSLCTFEPLVFDDRRQDNIVSNGQIAVRRGLPSRFLSKSLTVSGKNEDDTSLRSTQCAVD